MSEEAAKNADETKPERIILLNHYLTSGWCDPVTGACVTGQSDESAVEVQDAGNHQASGM
ncbi:hypothetical protein [Bifidobacterium crudilactis]|jgi:hypothetical protein|uniref:Uncharacterized protein n=1 Tax=Bifidobacterium crudilactis TaxID=327277 RepID=A0A971ICI6_9BIFI|nr:hypothetical protein [Bifidobacterium crudilactis]MCI1637557.1 hypothetical protein [Bifidobacterium crudilactis]MCI1888921.1 hypothetical protein [Bifidobacterium crudilactis]MDN5972410.1 hypothetical protein [Bifidobacterium crudilactis]MDN6000439.1 hypothetical protein [Bifidobacterium crudilactis]MDN6209957.1 hypothetical protein [Bifidobacterium crudilactis]